MNAKTTEGIKNSTKVGSDGVCESPGEQENLLEENAVLVQRTLRSGQSIHYDGNVVILGDVNPGAEVIATGSIIVMGVLRGVVHAGAGGDKEATVTALRLQPTQLRIAEHITRPPDEETIGINQPEIARIKDGIVIIEVFQGGGSAR